VRRCGRGRRRGAAGAHDLPRGTEEVLVARSSSLIVSKCARVTPGVCSDQLACAAAAPQARPARVVGGMYAAATR
jgi:hypothetical protein